MAKYETAALQSPPEMQAFIELMLREGVRSYLEVGAKFGGLLWRVGNALPKGCRVVTIDLPKADGSFKESQDSLSDCVHALKELGCDAHLHFGDSTSPEAIAFAEALGPFDLVMIDADHTEPFIRKDWANYGPMGRMVAFHDINWKPRLKPSNKQAIEVPKVWAEIKQAYRHQEICMEPRDCGIGILWR